MSMDKSVESQHLIRNKYMLYAFYLISSLGLTTVGAFLGAELYIGELPLLIMFFGVLLWFIIANGLMKKIAFYSFCFIEGVFLTPLIESFLETNAEAFPCAIGATLLITIIALIVGYKMNDLSFLRTALVVSLLGLIITTIISWFIYIPFLVQIGAILFSVYIAYDMNAYKLELNYTKGQISDDNVLGHVMNQYLNIINLFIRILNLLNDR